jgi:hypothetical protein
MFSLLGRRVIICQKAYNFAEEQKKITTPVGITSFKAHLPRWAFKLVYIALARLRRIIDFTKYVQADRRIKIRIRIILTSSFYYVIINRLPLVR